MSATDFLPRRDNDLRAWSVGFESKIAIEGESMGLSAEQIAEYSAAHALFLSTMDTVHDPQMRSPSNIVAKNTARDALRALARRLARIIRGHPGITDGQKSALGLTVRRGGGKQPTLPRPASAPVIEVRAASGRRVNLHLREPGSTRRGKPAGVGAALLFRYVGERPAADMGRWTYARRVTRALTSIDLPTTMETGTPGVTVWLTACWESPCGERGPFSTPTSVLAIRTAAANVVVMGMR